ncbi:hypothetical protein K9L67_05235 [Candidatus Woesearchaeota archaeon]|nr:hypothetical protein [Candidatus Woesearchaeota archaeon]MCF7901602.1 hypothetical protein [Candidatus Woesearchaeota archaeon]MCF8013525.1 hypothetical protein [Candidatus Woesearchaeota archaeon]
MREKLEKKRKAQALSLDLVIGVVIFILILIVVYSVLNADTPEQQKLRSQADSIEAKLERNIALGSGIPPVFIGDAINETALAQLYQSDYSKIKANLGLPGNMDVCIVVVDNLGAIKTYNELSSFGNGNGDLNISTDSPCGG